METFIVTLVGYDGPIKSEKALGVTSNEVYWEYRAVYPVDQYPQIKYIDVALIIK